jgi:chromosomal replication initiation ATPase DnaA
MTPPEIFNAIAQVFPVKPEDLTGNRRRRSEADARHCAVYLIHRHLRMSNHQVGAVFGRNGSTVCASRNRHSDLYATDGQYRGMVNQVIALLGLEAAA